METQGTVERKPEMILVREGGLNQSVQQEEVCTKTGDTREAAAGMRWRLQSIGRTVGFRPAVTQKSW